MLSDAWYKDKQSNLDDERLRIVRTAAKIILEDIRSTVCVTTGYPPSDEFLKDVDNMVPKSLFVFLQDIIGKYKRGDAQAWERKCTAISHAIMSATRPSSFLSPLQIGLSAFLSKKYG